jgi:carboxyl-terminal processing protease
MRRAIVVALAFSGISAAGAFAVSRLTLPHDPPGPETASVERADSSDNTSKKTLALDDDTNELHFRLPQGAATHVSCKEARRIVAQVRSELSYDPDAVDDKEFAASVGDWLDPHSFWSLPEDAPTQTAIDANAHALIAELESGGGECDAARGIGKALAAWSHELRGRFDTGAASAAAADKAHPEDKELPPSNEPSRARAEEVGRRAKAFRDVAGAPAEPYFTAARDRFFPEYDADVWSEIVLAAAVRAYVPLVDPHGAWAPLDEKASVYEVDLFAAPPEKPWGKVAVTSVGFRIEDHAAAPLEDDDVVLRVDGVNTAGMPLEQIEQLGFSCRQNGIANVVVSRKGAITPVMVPAHVEEHAKPQTPAEHVVVEHLPYGSEEVAVVAFQDVRDDLGEDIRDVIVDLEGKKVAGLILDLRGNGGGSTDGAINALGHFIPNAPLFPTKRRDGTIEVDHSPQSLPVWDGPVATLVDGSTASAAEMIAGALMAYARGPSVGATTFGKGCAQEYLDDEPQVGVLRLTTLLYSLPDGTPVQRIGLAPTLKLPFIVKTDDPHEREATLRHTAPTWRGPDKRNASLFTKRDSWTWPSNNGKVGPCEDPDVCRALRALGSNRRPQIAKNKPDAH